MRKIYLCLILLLAGAFAKAGTVTWTGTAGDGNWSTGGNWSTNAAPGPNDDVVFNTNATVSLDFSGSTTINSLTIGGNVTLQIALGASTTQTNLTIILGGGSSANGGGATVFTIQSGYSLILNETVTAGTNNAKSGITISVPTTYTASISGSLYLGQSTTGAANGIAQNQFNMLVGVDANSIIFNSGSYCYSHNSQGGSAFPFGNTAANNNVVEFKSGAKFLYYQGANPFGNGTYPASVVQFDQGSYYYIYGGTNTSGGFTGISGRTFGTLQFGSGATGTIANGTSGTTTILDSLLATSGTVTFSRASGGTAVPTYSIGSIRVTNNSATASGGLVLSNNGTDNASYTISGGVLITTLNTKNATLTLGASASNANNTITTITFSGADQSITSSQLSTGVASIAVNSPTSVSTGVKTTNIVIASTASISLNTNLDLTTSNSGVTSLGVQTGGALFVQPNRTLTIGSGGKLTTNGGFTLQSDATGTGSIGNSSGTITGTVTVQHYVPGNYAWRTVGFPFTAATTITGGAGNTSLSSFVTTPAQAYYYDETKDDQANYGTSGTVNAGWQAFTSSTSIPATAGVLLWGTSSGQTVSMSGTLNTGSQSISLSKVKSGWNLIANPYASNISWTSISGNNSSSLASNTVYRVNPLGNGTYSFSSYVAGSGTGSNGGSDVIENGASFFVQAASNGATFAIAESDKTTNAVSVTSGGISLLGNGNDNTIKLSLQGDANHNTDEVVFQWGRFSNATEGFDPQCDAYDLGAYNTHDLSILDEKGIRYSIFSGTAINGSSDVRSYKLGLRSLQEGTYTFNISIPGQLAGNSQAYIVDNYSHTTTSITDGTKYGFTVTTDASSKADGRFQLMLNKTTATTSAETNNGTTCLLNNPSTNNLISIRFGQDAQQVNWQLVDMGGKVISAGAFNNISKGSVKTVTAQQAVQSGAYLVRLTADHDPATVLRWIKL